jgi:predicted nucleotidyltransferase
MFEEMIESYLARLKECKDYDIKSVILFGSVARGQAKEHSDVDLIIVASGLPELKRRDILPSFPKPARIQDIWMTPEELDDMVIAKTEFVVDALLEGRVNGNPKILNYGNVISPGILITFPFCGSGLIEHLGSI